MPGSKILLLINENDHFSSTGVTHVHVVNGETLHGIFSKKYFEIFELIGKSQDNSSIVGRKGEDHC